MLHWLDPNGCESFVEIVTPCPYLPWGGQGHKEFDALRGNREIDKEGREFATFFSSVML